VLTISIIVAMRAVMMKEISISETSTKFYESTRCNIPKDCYPLSHTSFPLFSLRFYSLTILLNSLSLRLQRVQIYKFFVDCFGEIEMMYFNVFHTTPHLAQTFPSYTSEPFHFQGTRSLQSHRLLGLSQHLLYFSLSRFVFILQQTFTDGRIVPRLMYPCFKPAGKMTMRSFVAGCVFIFWILNVMLPRSSH
jgi:hypothetical protein